MLTDRAEFILNKCNEENDRGIDFDNFDMEAEIKLIKDNVEALDWKILVRAYIPANRGAFKNTSKTQEDKEWVCNIGYVIAISDTAYIDKVRWPMGPLVKVGDWISFPKYNQNYRQYVLNIPCLVLNEDVPALRVRDPRMLSTVYEQNYENYLKVIHAA